MPYRKPPSKAEMSAFRKAQTVKNITDEQRRKVRDAFRKKHDYYATGVKRKWRAMMKKVALSVLFR